MASPYYRTDSLSLTIMIFLLGWPGRCNKNPEHWQQRIQVFIVVQRIFITPLLGALKLRYFITFYNPPRVLRRVGTAEPGVTDGELSCRLDFAFGAGRGLGVTGACKVSIPRLSKNALFLFIFASRCFSYADISPSSSSSGGGSVALAAAPAFRAASASIMLTSSSW